MRKFKLTLSFITVILGVTLLLGCRQGYKLSHFNKEIQPKIKLEGKTLIYNTNSSELTQSKQITHKDYENVKAILSRAQVETLRITSLGGKVTASQDIANLVLKYNLNTEAEGECSSACIIIFVAGKKRTLLKNSKLGFHSPSSEIKDYEEARYRVEKLDKSLDYENTIIYNSRIKILDEIEFMISRGVNFDFISKAFRIHPAKMWYPSRKELTISGFINS